MITDITIVLAEDGRTVCCTGYTDDDRVALWSYKPTIPFDPEDEVHRVRAKATAAAVFAVRDKFGVLRLQ